MEDLKNKKHIVCFSGGHSSGLVAIEVVRKFGKENVVLLNHDINKDVEDQDIKRFKQEVADHLGIPITYANYKGLPTEDLPDQFDISLMKKGFKQPGTGNAFCTYELKTKPFHDYLKTNFPEKNCVCYYGFDSNENTRIQRRAGIMSAMGYRTDFPLALWERTILSTLEVAIPPPITYSHYKHANCAGCEKGGLQHWYVTYCREYRIFKKASKTEDELGYSLLRRFNEPIYLSELEPIFKRMKCAGVPDTEHYPIHKFKKYLKMYEIEEITLFTMPCVCAT